MYKKDDGFSISLWSIAACEVLSTLTIIKAKKAEKNIFIVEV